MAEQLWSGDGEPVFVDEMKVAEVCIAPWVGGESERGEGELDDVLGELEGEWLDHDGRDGGEGEDWEDALRWVECDC